VKFFTTGKFGKFFVENDSQKPMDSKLILFFTKYSGRKLTTRW